MNLTTENTLAQPVGTTLDRYIMRKQAEFPLRHRRAEPAAARHCPGRQNREPRSEPGGPDQHHREHGPAERAGRAAAAPRRGSQHPLHPGPHQRGRGLRRAQRGRGRHHPDRQLPGQVRGGHRPARRLQQHRREREHRHHLQHLPPRVAGGRAGHAGRTFCRAGGPRWRPATSCTAPAPCSCTPPATAWWASPTKTRWANSSSRTPTSSFRPRGTVFSCNEGYWFDYPEYVRDVSSPSASSSAMSGRYVGSLVADYHRNLFTGGIYLYPPTAKNPDGKLRAALRELPAGLHRGAGRRPGRDRGRGRCSTWNPPIFTSAAPLFIGSPELVASLLAEAVESQLKPVEPPAGC